jgi:hypothetical protein
MAEDLVNRQETHKLISQLKEMIGDNVDIEVLGGFIFEGNLADVDDELATLGPLNSCNCPTFNFATTAIIPPFGDIIFSPEISAITVNLEVITAVSRPIV